MIDRGNFVREVSIYCYYYYYYLIKPLVGIRLISHLYFAYCIVQERLDGAIGNPKPRAFLQELQEASQFRGTRVFRENNVPIYLHDLRVCPRATFVYPRKNTCIFQQIDRLTRRMRLIEREKERVIWKLVSLL